MAKSLFTVGPVLSFRGTNAGKWRVTALIGITTGSPVPKLTLEGKACPVPVVLLTRPKETILRYDLSCALQKEERVVEFGLEGEVFRWKFSVPGKDYAPRMAYVSCNGFSDPAAMRKLAKPENAVWADLIENHDSELRPTSFELDKEQLWHESRIHDKHLKRFHLLLMGGDQIYFDSIWEDVKSLKQWVGMSRKDQLKFKMNAALEQEIESYYFELYAKRWLPDTRRDWGKGLPNLDAADAMSRIPTVMMWDDHDIFDGWGSYSPEMQHCSVFQVLMRCARQAFWVFQLQHAFEDLPPLLAQQQRVNISKQDPQFEPIEWSVKLADDPLALPFLDKQPGFSFAHHIGPVSLYVGDLRTERSRTQVLGERSWKAMQDWLDTLRDGKPAHPGSKCQHLIFMSSVPVAHPKLSLAEGLLDTFGQDDVLDSNADDLKDHWSHGDHEGERKRLLETLTRVAEKKFLRVSIASGDVHVAAWGSCYRRDIPPTSNWAQVQQFTSSGVVHPSLIGVSEWLFLQLLNQTASKVQSIDVQHCVEMMLFPGSNRYMMPARNWLAFELDVGEGKGCKLWATWRCETDSGFSNHLQAVQPFQM